MSDEKKELGIVIGQLRYLTDEFHEVKRDVKMLVAWRWKLYGATAVVSIICTGVFEIFLAIARH